MGATENNLTEETKARLMDTYGLTEPEPPKSSFFQGDFGFSINLPILITSTILLLIAGSLFYYFLKKRKL